MKLKKEKSYGAIALKKIKGSWKVFLVRHLAKHWGFPKGHPKKSEKPFDTALRELEEESALTCKKLLRKTPFSEHYQFFREGHKVLKEVSYYMIEAQGDYKIQKDEILDGKWLSFSEANKTLTFQESKKILSQAQDFILKNQA